MGRRVLRTLVLALSVASIAVTAAGAGAASQDTVPERGGPSVTVPASPGDAVTVVGRTQAQLERSRWRQRHEPGPEIVLAAVVAAAVLVAIARGPRAGSARGLPHIVDASHVGAGRAPPRFA